MHLIKKYQKQSQAIEKGGDERLASVENVNDYTKRFIDMIYERNAYEKYGIGIASFKLFSNHNDNDYHLDLEKK